MRFATVLLLPDPVAPATRICWRNACQSTAMGMLVLNAVSVPIQALNMLNHAGALLLATDARFGGSASAGR